MAGNRRCAAARRRASAYGHGREADQLVQRLEALGRPPLDGVLDPLAEPEHAASRPCRASRRSCRGPARRWRRCWACAARRTSASAAVPVVAGLGEAAVELDDVLEGAVHALTEERDDGVGGVAEQGQPAAHPRPHPHRDQRADRVAGELAGAGRRTARWRRGSRGRSGRRTAPRSSSPANPAGPSNGQNSVAVKLRSGLGRAIIIESPRGQMCRAPGIEGEVAGRAGRDRQLLVPPRQVLLAVVGALAAHDRVAQRAVRAVGADRRRRGRRCAGPPAPSRVSSPVSATTPTARSSKWRITPGSFAAASSSRALSPWREIEWIAFEPSAL